jgi:hypothetical protein
MARVNVETRALAESRLVEFMKEMKWRRPQAIGTLVLLWHDSQERLIINATKQQIIRWIDSKNSKEAEKTFQALLDCEYIEALPEQLFKIKGNNKHVASLRSVRDRAKAAGKASGEVRNLQGNSEPKGNSGFDKSNPPVQQIEPISISNALAVSNTVGISNAVSNSDAINNSINNSIHSEKEKAALSVLADLWNSHCGQLPKIRECKKGTTRHKQAEARWKEKPDEHHWIQVIRRVSMSDFCLGNSDSGWRADFDWLIRPGTETKILEGKYDSRTPGKQTTLKMTHAQIREANNLALLDKIENGSL